MKKQKLILYIGTALCILSVLPFIISYASLPQMLPCQFGFDGSVTNYMDKRLFMVVVPGLFSFLNIYLYKRSSSGEKINAWNIALPLLCMGLMVYTYITSI